MQSSHHPPEGALTAVLLPGSGSDEVFVRAALAAPLRAIGLTVHTPPVRPGPAVVDGYLEALESAALDGPVLVGGISLGAQVAVRWAASRGAGGAIGAFGAGGAGGSGDVAGLLLAMPAWTGDPGPAPAAVAAAVTADAVRRDGLAATIDRTRAQTPAWLGEELTRAWRRHGAGLADSLDAAAATPGPTAAELAGLRVPVAVVGMRDDPVHPLPVAREWAELAPRSALVSSTLAALGRDREALGRALALAWLRASSLAVPVP